MTQNYNILDKYLIRTPLLANKWKDVKEENIKQILRDKHVKEAIYLASPDLYKMLLVYMDNKIIDLQKEKKILYSILKYLYRMSDRSTPFGVFAGVAIGEYSRDVKKIDIERLSKDTFNKITRLDMNYLCEISQNIEENIEIRNKLLYYPNTSIYNIGDNYRYVEFRYKYSKRTHYSISINKTDYIDFVLKDSEKGKYKKDLAVNLYNYIKDENILLNQVEEYIDDLIDNQILISSISPAVSGNDYLDILIKNTELDYLKEKKYLINRIDSDFILIHENYSNIEEEFQKLEIPFNSKYLFQTDLLLKFKKNVIPNYIKRDIKKGVFILNKIIGKKKNNFLDNFKIKFYERYENEEIPLALALDVETGIGYGEYNKELYDINPLIDDIFLDNKIKENNILNDIPPVFLREKYIKVLKGLEERIDIKDEDLLNLEYDIEGCLPDSFSVMCSLLQDENNEYVINMKSIGGATSTYLLGRYSHMKEEIEMFLKEITTREQDLNNDKILAEIVHLPENRTGNILYRKKIRDFEIPYLAKSNINVENQITIDDLYVSVKNDKVELRSKKFNKIVEPRMANTHYFDNPNSLPIYRFLCDLQYQSIKGSLHINMDRYLIDYKHVPRITYKNIIFNLEKWLLNREDIQNIKTIKDVKNLKEKIKLKERFLITEYDNELPININNDISCEVFLNEIKNKYEIILIEDIFSQYKSVVRENNKEYSNEFIFSLIKK